MAVHDMIGDMLTKVRNAGSVLHEDVTVRFSKMNAGILDIFSQEGFIDGYELLEEGNKKDIVVKLAYYQNRSAILGVKRMSKPGRRVYVSVDKIPKIKNGLGVVVLSTSKGIVSGKTAKELKVGGEFLCYLW